MSGKIQLSQFVLHKRESITFQAFFFFLIHCQMDSESNSCIVTYTIGTVGIIIVDETGLIQSSLPQWNFD